MYSLAVSKHGDQCKQHSSAGRSPHVKEEM